MSARNGEKLMNVGPKSAAWLRQVGIRGLDGLREHGAVGAFAKIKRAGFRPSLNLLYALEGALLGCHWQQVPESRRAELLQEAEAAIAQLPQAKGRAAGAVIDISVESDATQSSEDSEPAALSFGDD